MNLKARLLLKKIIPMITDLMFEMKISDDTRCYFEFYEQQKTMFISVLNPCKDYISVSINDIDDHEHIKERLYKFSDWKECCSERPKLLIDCILNELERSE